MIRIPITVVSLVVVPLLLSGCGGGGTMLGRVKGQLTESDGRARYWDPNRPADLWMCTAQQSGTGTVVMRSDVLDSEMYTGDVEGDGTLTRVSWSDDRGIGGDEEWEFSVVKDQVYFVIATTPANGPETGPYSLTFSKELGNVRAVALTPGQVIPLKAVAEPAERVDAKRPGEASGD